MDLDIKRFLVYDKRKANGRVSTDAGRGLIDTELRAFPSRVSITDMTALRQCLSLMKWKKNLKSICDMDFVDFNLAKKLKEKGYPQRTFGKYDMQGACYIEDGRFYENGCITEVARAYTAPTNSQVLDWLRKEHHLHFEVVAAAYGYNLIISDTPDKGGTDRYYSHANDDGPNDGGAWDEHKDCIMYGIEYVLDNLI